jgi:hypothetical protein
MGRIKMVPPLVPKGDRRTVEPEPKQADPFYHSAGHEAFRHAVLSRAGYRCEWAKDHRGIAYSP